MSKFTYELARERKFITKKNIFIFAAIVLVCAAIWLFYALAPNGGTAEIKLDGELYETVDFASLEAAKEIFIDPNLAGGVELTITADSTGISVTRATCPDKTCVETGKIARAGEVIICLPAKLSITVSGASDADAITY